MKYLFLLFYLLLFILFSACKSTQKTLTNPIGVSLEETTSKIATLHQAQHLDKNTIEAKADARYKNGKEDVEINLKIRIKKDSIIWLSGNLLGIPLAKVIITPQKISYYEKLNKTYFEGDFQLIKDIFGVELGFDQIQNLFFGQAFFPSTKGMSEIQEGSYYKIYPVKQHPKYEIYYLVNPNHFKLFSQQVFLPNDEVFSVTYSSYIKKENVLFPEKILINSEQQGNKTDIFLDIKNVQFNTRLTFPFEIPKDYNELDFNDLKK